MRTILMAVLIFTVQFNTICASDFDGISKVQQEKNKYIILQINKFDQDQIDKLIAELMSYQGKIADAVFNAEHRQLTIYYTSSIALRDIYQVVGKYFKDFDKISGTELP